MIIKTKDGIYKVKNHKSYPSGNTTEKFGIPCIEVSHQLLINDDGCEAIKQPAFIPTSKVIMLKKLKDVGNIKY